MVKNSADNFSWLKRDLAPSTKRLFGQAACYAKIFGVERNAVRPEFVIAAVLNSPVPCCQDFTDALSATSPDFKPYCIELLSELYGMHYPDISDRLQGTQVPKVFQFSHATKVILRTAAQQWAKETTDLPIPIDYVLFALLSCKKPLDLLDNLLHDCGLDREDMAVAFMVSSRYFSVDFDFRTGDETDETKPSRSNITSINRFVLPDRIAGLKAIVATEKHLLAHIIGQTTATARVIEALRRATVGLKSAHKPIGMFLFAGYTGVGKTEFARQLSAVTGMPMLRLDMSEYGESHHASRLFGSPPGYVGSQEGGQLTNFVMENPASVIVFDELEKAHPDIFNSLLQIAEEASLTDGKGNRVDFQRTIVILTTNLGAREAMQKPVGFGGPDKTNSDLSAFQKAIEKNLRPELLGRIGKDNIVIFDQLSKENLLAIAKLELAKITTNMADHSVNIKIRFAQNVAQQILSMCDTSNYGARSLAKTIDLAIATPLAEFMLGRDIRTDQTISVSYNAKHGFVFQVEEQRLLASQ